MLLSKRNKVITPKTYHKILYLYPALDETFVFLGMLGLRQDCVTHMDKKGNILFQHVFQKPMDAFGMLSESQAILIETRGNCITVLDLKTHQFTRTSHHFFNEQSDQSNIITFAQTKYLCIEQEGRYNDNRFKLSYYTYPLTPESKPFNVYEAKNNEWNYEHIVKKVNDHSMMAWFKPRQDRNENCNWQFKVYDLRNNSQGEYRFYQFPQQIGIPYNMPKLQVAINTMWQTTRDHLLMVCITNKTQTQKNKQLDVVQNNFVCDLNTGNIRQAKFGFGQLHDYLIDYFCMGKYCTFRTFNFQKGKPIPSPIYYIDNLTEKIVDQQKWQCSYLHKYSFPGYDGSMLVENLHENADCEWFECIQKKVVDLKQMTLFTLLQINQEFDEDLLYDVLTSMEFDENQGKEKVQTN